MRARLALGGVALLLAGCISLDPAYRRPAPPVAPAFPTGPAYPQASAGAYPVLGWREVFADPNLIKVIEQALADNRDLRLAVANIAAARAQVQSERAALFPHLQAQAGVTYGQIPLGAQTGIGSTQGLGKINQHQYTAGLAVSAWQLDLFGRVRSLTRAAQNQYFATQQARDAAQITLIAEVANDYLTLAADRDRLAIANDTVRSSEISASLTRSRFAGGIASRQDVAQAETILQQARFDVASLTTTVAKDRNALELVVGGPVSEARLSKTLGAPVLVLSRLPSGLSSEVLLNRPDVLEAEDQLKAQNANIGAARAAFFPTLSLTSTGGFTSTALSRLFTGPASTWTFVPELAAPIFEGGANLANLRYARAQRDAAVAQYEHTIQTAFREVADALASRGTIDARLDAQRALVAAAAEALTIANARYEKGADTYLNALIAQRTDYAARQTLVLTQLEEQTNLVTLYTALGGGLDVPGGAGP